MDWNMDHEKIPFIDEKDLTDISIKNSEKNTPQVFVEMENKSHEKLKNTDVGKDTVDVSILAADFGRCDSLKQSDIPESAPVRTMEKRNNSFKFPLHSAAEKGNVKKLERLLLKSDPLIRDFKNRTPLHYACGFGYQKKALRMVEACLNSPQAQNTPDDGLRKKKLIDGQDNNGETGLHIAARTGHREVVEKLLFSAADVNLKDNKGFEPLQLIYSKVPAAMKPVFDGAVECKVGDPYDQNLTVRFDFGSIVGYPEIEKDLTTYELETKLLSYSLQQSEQKRAAILLHPIVQVFLHLKCKKIRILFWISILYHVIWLLLYTLFITDLYLMQCPYRAPEVELDFDQQQQAFNNDSNFNLTGQNITEIENESVTETNVTSNATAHSYVTTCEIGIDLFSSLNVKLAFLFGSSISVAFKELYEIYSTPQLKFYFIQLENVGQWILLGVVGLTSIPVFLRDTEYRIAIHAWQYQAAALGIFLAWSLILSQIGKIPRFGIYIEILGKVLRSFVMFMITFASLLVAFTVSFQILMPEKVEFHSFPWGFIKVLVMMAGEVNYDDVFYSEDASATIPFPTSTKLLYAAFVSVVTIILFNLLIGLTVSDIQGLQNVAQLTSLSSQLDQIYLMEKFVISKNVQRWLKRINKNHWTRFFLVTQQTDDVETNMGVDIHISKIPRDLQHQVREVAVPNYKQDNDNDDSDDDNEPSEREGTEKSDNVENESSKEVAVKAEIASSSSSSSQFGSRSTVATDTLKEQIRDILKELLEELRIPKPLKDDEN